MKEFIEKIWLLYMGLAFVFFTFGFWSIWTLVLGVIGGLLFEAMV